ncbi:MAG: chloride channel protein [Firmicutes bacterium]|nr:chloride channel protein [Bacillota bacterium]
MEKTISSLNRGNLRDFSTNGRRLALLSVLAIVIGLIGGLIAWILLRLIGLITHLAYNGKIGWSLVAPNVHHWGIWSVAVPIAGGLVVGLLAKYGTEKIRGHGIPEAIQAILENDSKMEPRVALIKPIASAITIGTGGPFGAEGPIIMTAGAIGSLVGQFLRLSSMERRTLLVAGAAAGMSATFGAPVSSVLLAVELLLFEWRPRSLVPVALASTVAEGVRVWLLGTTPIFATGATLKLPWSIVIWAICIGIAAGFLSGVLTKFVYWTEDIYRKLPVHWAWWPAIGGLVVGIGGLINAAALGVGYPTIRLLDSGQVVWIAALSLFAVKAVIWVVSLSSGTSGGVLAPLLMLGGALGVILSPLFPDHLVGIWATIGMAAMLGGTMRAPFTATIFTMETTHNWTLLLPVFMASIAGMAVTVLWIPRSILTEKLARRGVHVAREYAVDSMERESVREIMVSREKMTTVPMAAVVGSIRAYLSEMPDAMHNGYPVVDNEGDLRGIIYWSEMLSHSADRAEDLMHPVTSIEDWQQVRAAMGVMAREQIGQVAVVDRTGSWVGWISRRDIFTTFRRALDAEEQHEPPYSLPWLRALWGHYNQAATIQGQGNTNKKHDLAGRRFTRFMNYRKAFHHLPRNNQSNEPDD